MKNFLVEKIRATCQMKFDLHLDNDEVEISQPPEGMGDFAINVAMKLAGRLKRNPQEIAREIGNEIEKLEQVERISVEGPGFLNLFLSDTFFREKIQEIYDLGDNYGAGKKKSERVMVEFVSANPTGPIHIGNGRGAPLGDSLANVLELAGYQVSKEYYLNDFGNQIKILGHSVKGDVEAQYKGDYIEELRKKIGNKGDAFELGQKAAEIITKEIIQPSMERVGVSFDSYFSEKTLHQQGKIEKVLEDFKKRDLVYEKDDAFWFRASKFGDEKDRVVRKKTGEFTYFGTDIAYHQDKFQRGFDRLINIWGADHHGDVSRVMGAVNALGYEGKLEIIISQMVRIIKDGQEFKMSKRTGNYVTLTDLINEVGVDAVRFFFLLRNSKTHIDFDIDLAKKKSNENPVFYVQYAHARMASILKKVKQEEIEKVDEAGDFNLVESELRLIKEVMKFPDLVVQIASSYEVHKLAHYAMNLAETFHSFYHSCQVIDVNEHARTAFRIKLIYSTKKTLAKVLNVLGVTAPNKM